MFETIDILPERDRRRQQRERVYPDPGVPVLMWPMDEARHHLLDGEWHSLEEMLSLSVVTQSMLTRLEEQHEVRFKTEDDQISYCQTRRGFDIYHCFVCGRSLPSVLCHFQDVPPEVHPYSLIEHPSK